jgi:hypothetical protein
MKSSSTTIDNTSPRSGGLLSPALVKLLSRCHGYTSLAEEGIQHPRLKLPIDQSHDDMVPQLLAVPCRQVAQPAVFRPTPHPFIGVQRRSVSRKVLHHHLGMLGQPRFHHLRPPVDLAPVPHHREPTTQLPTQRRQKRRDFFPMRGLVQRQQFQVQSRPSQQRAKRDATNGRDTVAAVPVVQ